MLTFYLCFTSAIIIYLIVSYNHFIRMDNYCKEGWSGIGVQLKRRYDLIPMLVETVKGYAVYEPETLEKILLSRNQAQSHVAPKDKAVYENQMIADVKKIFALVEAYPELKADRHFLQLQDTLVEIEDALQKMRRYYNATVRNYNMAVDTIPSCFVAQIFHFQRKPFFEIDTFEHHNVKVNLS